MLQKLLDLDRTKMAEVCFCCAVLGLLCVLCVCVCVCVCVCLYLCVCLCACLCCDVHCVCCEWPNGRAPFTVYFQVLSVCLSCVCTDPPPTNTFPLQFTIKTEWNGTQLADTEFVTVNLIPQDDGKFVNGEFVDIQHIT